MITEIILISPVVLPHTSYKLEDTISAMYMLAAQNLLAGLEGKPMPAQVPL